MKTKNIFVKAVTFALFGLLILSFAVWGIGDIFRGAGRAQTVAEVGDVEIGAQEFAQTLTREMNRLSQRFGGRLELEQARALGIVDQVIGQMVGRALFDQKADDMGLMVTEEQIRQRITEEPAFRNELDQFDRNQFALILQRSGLSEQAYVQSLRREILREQIATAVTDALDAPKDLADVLYRYRAQERIAQVIVIPKSGIADIPEPDAATLEAFYQDVSSDFMAPEYRAVSYIHLQAADLASEVAVSDAEVEQEFEARKEDFAVPEKRRIEQIVFLEEEKAQAAKQLLDEGQTFEAVAEQLSGQPPVDLGMTEKDQLPDELADEAFALEPDAISAPIKSAFGWHLVKVREVEPAAVPQLDQLRDELRGDLAMARAIESMVSIANQLDDELASGATLDEAAQRLNLEVERLEAVDRDGQGRDGTPVADLPGARFLEVAFETDPGSESLLTETNEGDYFVVRVDGVTPAEVRPLAAVRDDVLDLWRDAQRAERTTAIANDIAERARQGETLEDIASAEGYEVQTLDPLTRFDADPEALPSPELPATLFELEKGEVETVSGQDGAVVVRLREVRPADPATADAQVATLRAGLAAAMRTDVLEQFVASLRDQYGVEINQGQVENVLAAY